MGPSIIQSTAVLICPMGPSTIQSTAVLIWPMGPSIICYCSIHMTHGPTHDRWPIAVLITPMSPSYLHELMPTRWAHSSTMVYYDIWAHISWTIENSLKPPLVGPYILVESHWELWKSREASGYFQIRCCLRIPQLACPSHFPASSSCENRGKIIYCASSCFRQPCFAPLLVCCLRTTVLAWYPEAGHCWLARLHGWLLWLGPCWQSCLVSRQASSTPPSTTLTTLGVNLLPFRRS